ncbi:MAG: hypothetical protein HDT48_05925 [Ruminococcaceae bacterium]|nr:hypothetical protein [Oscillospiraceae bacterium]
MTSNEKKGITVKIDADLHAEVRQYIEKHEMTMAEFITLALQDELHPKQNMMEVKTMGNMRTLAFQVPEELFQQIKDYLQRNNMTQKEFVIGLIESEIERDLAQRQTESEVLTDTEEMAEEETETQETAAVSDCEDVSEEVEEELEEQESEDFSEDFEGESEEDEDLDDGEDFEEGEEQDEDEDIEENEEQDESEDMGMSMGM